MRKLKHLTAPFRVFEVWCHSADSMLKMLQTLNCVFDGEEHPNSLNMCLLGRELSLKVLSLIFRNTQKLSELLSVSLQADEVFIEVDCLEVDVKLQALGMRVVHEEPGEEELRKPWELHLR